LECADIRHGFVAGRVPTGPEADAHLQGCAACRELFQNEARLGRQLAQAVLPEVELGGLLELVERDVASERGLRARLRELPIRVRAGSLIAVATALVISHLLWRPRPDLAVYSPVVFALALALFGVAMVFGAVRLTRGLSTPLDAAGRERALGITLFVVPALGALLVPLGSGSSEAAASWGHPGNCFIYGAALVAPVSLLYWLFERRDQPPATALFSAGGLAGVAANLLLCAHCPSVHPGHLLLGHVSIGVAWALGLWLALKPRQLAR
jgi:negative regulator of sigma F NrsF-like protein